MKHLNTPFLLVAFLLLVPPVLTAQDNLRRSRHSTISGIDFVATNYGVFGLDVDAGIGGFRYPRGAVQPYLFGAGLWFGAQKKTGPGTLRTYSFVTYNTLSGDGWATPGEATEQNAAFPDLYHSTDYDHTTGFPNAGTGPNWPLWLRPGTLASPMHPGVFVPLDGERSVGEEYSAPAFIPGADEEFLARYHDGNLEQYEIGAGAAKEAGYPIGLQFQQRIYGWQNGLMKSVVILAYDVVNISADTLWNCLIVQATDADVGDHRNDYNMFYAAAPELKSALNWTDPEQLDYGSLLTTMLEGPITDTEGFVDNSRRREFKEADATSISRNYGLEEAPMTPEERYSYIATGEKQGRIGPDEISSVIGPGKFHMAPGDTLHFAVAYTVLEDLSDPATDARADEIIRNAATEVLRQYYSDRFSAVLPSGYAEDKLHAGIYPNPMSGGGILEVSLPQRTPLHLHLYDQLGRSVERISFGTVEAGTHRFDLNFPNPAAGLYVAEVQAGSLRQSVQMVVVR